MALNPGTRLGPYEITAPIGAGGMGEVYRAKDTNLNRDVAIKVLPESFALDADRLARFTREAKTLASLNHPNIAAIYGTMPLRAVDGSEGIAMRIRCAGHLKNGVKSQRVFRLAGCDRSRRSVKGVRIVTVRDYLTRRSAAEDPSLSESHN